MDEAIPEVVELVFDKILEYVEIDNIPFAPGHVKDRLKKIFGGWHVTVATSAFIALVVLTTNLGLLIWGQLSHIGNVRDGVFTLYSGDCSRMRKIFTWSHVGINILSTMLLAASNTSCQILSAPTRKEVDMAHKAGYWLDVGVSSFRNLRFVALKRLVVYVLLVLSSIPLHLIYNSILFPTTIAYENLATYVTHDFISGAAWNKTQFHDKHYITALSELQQQAVQHRLEKLDVQECTSQLSSSYISKYRNFLIVLKHTPKKLPPIVYGTRTKALLSDTNMDWLCRMKDDVMVNHGAEILPYKCLDKSAAIINNPTSWGLKVEGNEVVVHYCLVETAKQECEINLSRSLLISVIICNFAKLICFVLVVRWSDGKPLVTVGDCISSFLQKPDPSTENLGPVSALEVREGIWCGDPDIVATYWPDRGWAAKSYLWYSASGWKRWVISSYFILSMYVPAISFPVLLFMAAGQTWGNISNMGSISENLVLRVTAGWNIPSEVVFVNLPQLLLSFGYLFINNILTNCLQASECGDYAKERKGLRVTTSRNHQRSTYWLQIPYRYAIPIMVCWIVVHWITSQSIYLARVKLKSFMPGSNKTIKLINGCGYSPSAVMIVMSILGAMILGMYLIGFRRYPNNIPLMSSCTVAIAAACHASRDEGTTMAELPLQYGVLKTSKEEDGVRYRRVGFSSLPVESLVKGEVYK